MKQVTQQLFDKFYANARKNRETLYDTAIYFYSTLCEPYDTDIDTTEVEEDILFDIEIGTIDYETIEAYCNQVNPIFRKTAYAAIEEGTSFELLCAYMKNNDLETEKYVELAALAVATVLPSVDTEIELLAKLKEDLTAKGLYDKTVEELKSSGEPETLVCAALCFSPELIDEIFGGKENMYLYLTANTFTDDHNIKSYKELLLSMNDKELQSRMTTKAESIDQKIKQLAPPKQAN